MITIETIQDHIPSYLAPKQQAELVEGLRDFENRNLYAAGFAGECLQGDGWTSIQIVRFADGRRDKVKGILISNTCDIDPKNARIFPPQIVFAPLVRLDAYEKALKQKISAEQVRSKVAAIRKQQVTSLFYLPAEGTLDGEHIAILDDLHSIPYRAFEAERTRTKIFTLNQIGFYLFVIKLSIHFCRFNEGIARG